MGDPDPSSIVSVRVPCQETPVWCWRGTRPGQISLPLMLFLQGEAAGTPQGSDEDNKAQVCKSEWATGLENSSRGSSDTSFTWGQGAMHGVGQSEVCRIALVLTSLLGDEGAAGAAGTGPLPGATFPGPNPLPYFLPHPSPRAHGEQAGPLRCRFICSHCQHQPHPKVDSGGCVHIPDSWI